METAKFLKVHEVFKFLNLSKNDIGKVLNLKIKEPDSVNGFIESWEIKNIEPINNLYLIQREFSCDEKKARKIMENCIRISAEHKGPLRTDIGSDAGKKIHLLFELTGLYAPRFRENILFVKTKIIRKPIEESV